MRTSSAACPNSNSSLVPKLSRIHRRVFPLSLFPTSEPSSPLKLNITQTFLNHSPVRAKNYHKKNNKSLSIPQRSFKGIPRITVEDFKQSFDKPLDRQYYKPNSIQISPRSKVTVYTLKPLLREPSRRKTKSNKEKKKCAEVTYEEVKTNFKLKRITSSKILFPATTIGQIMMRVRDLVIDPLKIELKNFLRHVEY